MTLNSKILAATRQVKDFPKPGINFYDITTVLADGELLSEIIDLMSQQVEKSNADTIIGIESRGFIFGAAIASKLKLPFVPVRKPGKLPYDKSSIEYTLEYGSATLEIHSDAVRADNRVLIVDDLLATGGTAAATGQLISELGASVAGYSFVFELAFLNGREKLKDASIYSLVQCNS
jgi:adenine phosphoribosyltransferase